MDATLHRPARNASVSVNPSAAAEIIPNKLTSGPVGSINLPTATARKRKGRRKQISDAASSTSSSNCGSVSSNSQRGFRISSNPKLIRAVPSTKKRRSVDRSDVDALALPLGMSIAIVVAQVLERKNASERTMSAEYLSEICALAVRESLGNVFGDKFDNFVMNFEKSFRSTLGTLRLISESSRNVEKLQKDKDRGYSSSVCRDELNDPSEIRASVGTLTRRNSTKQHRSDEYREDSFEEVSTLTLPEIWENSVSLNANPDSIDSLLTRVSTENLVTDLTSQQVVLHRESSANSGITTFDKYVTEQVRSNNLKTFELGLIMKKIQLKEKQLTLNTHANFLERWKLSMGLSKASFKFEKFTTQVQDTRQVELLKKCLDFLAAGLIMMLLAIAYGAYVYSYRRIVEATEACSPYKESSKSSWWMPKSVSTFSSGFQFIKCQFQVLSRMLFGVLLIAAIAVLLIQRSSASHQTMPITFMVLLLGIACGSGGKFCIDTLGGSGYHWLTYWEALCALHFLCNIFGSTLFLVLYGPVVVAGTNDECSKTKFPYWLRRMVFFATLLLLPLLCGLMPFATPREWLGHFSSEASDFMTWIDD